MKMSMILFFCISGTFAKHESTMDQQTLKPYLTRIRDQDGHIVSFYQCPFCPDKSRYISLFRHHLINNHVEDSIAILSNNHAEDSIAILSKDKQASTRLRTPVLRHPASLLEQEITDKDVVKLEIAASAPVKVESPMQSLETPNFSTPINDEPLQTPEKGVAEQSKEDTGPSNEELDEYLKTFKDKGGNTFIFYKCPNCPNTYIRRGEFRHHANMSDCFRKDESSKEALSTQQENAAKTDDSCPPVTTPMEQSVTVPWEVTDGYTQEVELTTSPTDETMTVTTSTKSTVENVISQRPGRIAGMANALIPGPGGTQIIRRVTLPPSSNSSALILPATTPNTHVGADLLCKKGEPQSKKGKSRQPGVVRRGIVAKAIIPNADGTATVRRVTLPSQSQVEDLIRPWKKKKTVEDPIGPPKKREKTEEERKQDKELAKVQTVYQTLVDQRYSKDDGIFFVEDHPNYLSFKTISAFFNEQNKVFVCPKCNASFVKLTGFEIHLAGHAELTCDCNVTFTNAQMLKLHREFYKH